ncbi:hypothetical protein [Paractinoplanes maris]|uniref:hypothetical protein n=1 Tax=Paractinoplanes maris TaxID=1734446 RepID=UPI00202171D0|nr:hypothetical protein [Actinoplanes maris]
MRLKEVRRRCRKTISRLDIPEPFDLQELCRRIAASRGRPIDLVPTVMPLHGPTGVWIATSGRDYILYEQNTVTLHQEHIIVHELGHLLDDHGGTGLLTSDIARLLLPDLDGQMVSRVLGRTAYSDEQELIAETIATMILEAVNRWKPLSEWEAPASGAGARHRIHLTVEPSTERWPQ